ncbi:MAG: FKBP-type peptidyl-prolyl cis-trans isomerase [Bdellovibrionia bacterium]
MNKATLAIIAIVVVAVGAWISMKSSEKKTEDQAQTQPVSAASPAAAASAAPAAATTVAPVTELKIEDQVVGTGAEAGPGKMVSVHYTGTLTDGSKFDSSLDRNQPFSFRMSKDPASRQVIEGWEKGLTGMKVGGKRRLIIPPQMAYGPEGRPPVIPPNATLVFDIQLLSVAD